MQYEDNNFGGKFCGQGVRLFFRMNAEAIIHFLRKNGLK